MNYKKEGNVVFFEKAWITVESTSVEEEGKDTYITGLALPFNKVSRNGVLYQSKSIEETHSVLVGKPLMYNHVIEGREALPLGKVTQTWIEADGLHYKARLSKAQINQAYVELIKEGILDNVSIQIMGKATQRKDEETDEYYQEAEIQDWLELSVVPVPGFIQATARMEGILKEAFGGKKEDSSSIDFSKAIRVNPEFALKSRKALEDAKIAFTLDGDMFLFKSPEEKDKAMAVLEKTDFYTNVEASKHESDTFDKLAKWLYGKVYGALGSGQQTKVRKLLRSDPTIVNQIEDVGSGNSGDLQMKKLLLLLPEEDDEEGKKKVLESIKIIINDNDHDEESEEEDEKKSEPEPYTGEISEVEEIAIFVHRDLAYDYAASHGMLIQQTEDRKWRIMRK